MILTASTFVNIRKVNPSTNAPNPTFLKPGESVNAVSRVIGDTVNGNNIWVVTDKDEFVSAEGFVVPNGISSLPISGTENFPKIFRELNLSLLWDLPMKPNISVGLIDTGVTNHTALKQRIFNLNPQVAVNPEPNNHATTMACIIAGNDIGKNVIGVAPSVDALFSYTLPGFILTTSAFLDALNLMEESNARVINISFSTNDPSFVPNDANLEAIRIQEKIKELNEKGFILVCSAGNKGSPKKFYPAGYDGVISVSGFMQGGVPDPQSNFWEGVSVCMCSDFYFDQNIFPHSFATSSAAALISGCIAAVYPFLQGNNKTATLADAFKLLPSIKFSFESKMAQIPKFETETFIHLIKP